MNVVDQHTARADPRHAPVMALQREGAATTHTCFFRAVSCCFVINPIPGAGVPATCASFGIPKPCQLQVTAHRAKQTGSRALLYSTANAKSPSTELAYNTMVHLPPTQSRARAYLDTTVRFTSGKWPFRAYIKYLKVKWDWYCRLKTTTNPSKIVKRVKRVLRTDHLSDGSELLVWSVL